MSTITLRLLKPDAGTRLLWRAVDAVVERLPESEERNAASVSMSGAALGLCLGYPLSSPDLLAYGDSVIASLQPRATPDALQAAVEAALLLIQGDAPADPQPEAQEVPSAPPAPTSADHAPPVTPWGPPTVPDPPSGASSADIALWQRARFAPGGPNAPVRVKWRARHHELVEEAHHGPADPLPGDVTGLPTLPDGFWSEDDDLYTHTIDGALSFYPSASRNKIKALAYDKVTHYGTSKRNAIYLSAREVLGAITALGVKRFLYHHEATDE